MAFELTDRSLLPSPRGRRAPAAILAPGGIEFEDLTVTEHRQVRLSHLHLVFPPASFGVLTGPSGAGKSTALRALAGSGSLASGRVKIGGRDVTDLPVGRRGIAVITAANPLPLQRRLDEAVAAGLGPLRWPRQADRESALAALRLVGLSDLAARPCHALTPEQRLRGMVARAMIRRPRVLLVDEPFPELPADAQSAFGEELRRLQRMLPGLSLLLATRDRRLALSLADHLALLADGRLVARGTPQDLLRRPPNRLTAAYLGDANLLEVTIAGHADDGLMPVRFGAVHLLASEHPTLGPGNRALLSVRPERICAEPANRTNCLTGQVRGVIRHADGPQIEVTCGEAVIRMTTTPLQAVPQTGAGVTLCFDPSDAVLVPR
jgi:2-aminoethylphosphonate transport system ATP-binding protein